VGQLVRRSAEEQREIIHLVEHSALSVKRALAELDVPRSSFYRWYQRYQADGVQGLQPQPSQRRRFWNRIPEPVRQEIVELALAQPDQSPRQLAWQFTDREGYFVSAGLCPIA
jgi:putative transposase